jgi:hypothetical protein
MAPPTTELAEIVERLRRAKETADAETESARATAGAAEEGLVESVATGAKVDAAEKRVVLASAALVSAELRQRATAQALARAEQALEEAGRKTEIERQKALHGVAVEAHALARERVPQAWASLEKAFSECLALQSAARWSYAAAKDLGATFENRTPQEVTTFAELTQLRKLTTERLMATGHDPLIPQPPALTVAGYQL